MAGEHDAESRNVLTEELEHGLLDPPIAEVHTRPVSSGMLRRAPGVQGALEERHPCLRPEAALEKHRGVDRRGEHGRGHRLS